MPFQWGGNDCCLFACDAIVAITGRDPVAKTYRGKYQTALGAKRLLDRNGGPEGIAAKVCVKLGFQEINPLLAQRGDVVSYLSPVTGEVSLGVCIGMQAAFPGLERMELVLTGDCRKAWRVG